MNAIEFEVRRLEKESAHCAVSTVHTAYTHTRTLELKLNLHFMVIF